MAEPPPTSVRLQNIAQSYGQSGAPMAAVEIGVFAAIGNRNLRWRRFEPLRVVKRTPANSGGNRGPPTANAQKREASAVT